MTNIGTTKRFSGVKRELVYVVLFFLVFALMAMLPGSSLAEDGSVQPLAWYNIHANELKVAFWTGIEPHYGAFFAGSNGNSQYYTGSDNTCGSSAGCISSWNWYGSDLNVLLVPKGNWLTCITCSERWDPENYWASLWIV